MSEENPATRRPTPAEPDWIELPARELWMGGGSRSNENPRHLVRLGAFRLARTVVTRAEFAGFLAATGHPEPPFWGEDAFSHPRMPVVGPSWHDAVHYCEWLGAGLHQVVRLPTEAEWESAATDGREVAFPWGDASPETLPGFAFRWRDGPEPVDAYPSLHPRGFLGLCENVHEWCSDWYDADYYASSPEVDPHGPASGRRRVSRGGAWRHRIPVCRCTHRSSIPPSFQYADYGFRVAADVPEAPA